MIVRPACQIAPLVGEPACWNAFLAPRALNKHSIIRATAGVQKRITSRAEATHDERSNPSAGATRFLQTLASHLLRYTQCVLIEPFVCKTAVSVPVAVFRVHDV
jgi:hypothetical protein